MQPANRTFGFDMPAQPIEILDRHLAAAAQSRTAETPRRLSERLGYWRPSEADLIRHYAGRCYADDSRAERDRCVGRRAMPMPNFGGSLTGNAAALCCDA